MNTVKQRFIIFCAFVAVIAMGLGVLVVRTITGGTPEHDPMAKSKNINSAERGLTLTERLGVDDNAALAFLYGADMQGSLDLCG